MHADQEQAIVAVVLCTYNGEKHLEEQLQSLVSQTWPISVHVFDDCSSDSTLALLDAFEADLPLNVHTHTNNLGYVLNFEHAIASVLEERFSYIALCDQDDIWESTRIAEGMNALQKSEKEFGNDAPLLAHTDLRLVDSNKKVLHDSFLQYRRYGLSNAKNVALMLGQNGVMGNTILMNKAMASFALPFPKALHVHDYWLALLSELYGHRIFIDKPLVNYRIHVGNASNSSESIPLGQSDSSKKQSLRERFLHRDQELPFMEDSRLQTINFITDNTSRFPALGSSDQKILSVFRDYLELKKPRTGLLLSMLKHGFFRTGLKHRFKIIYRILVTTRYKQ